MMPKHVYAWAIGEYRPKKECFMAQRSRLTGAIALLLGCWALLAATSVSASAAVRGVTLAEAERMALGNSRQIAIAKDSLVKARARITQARGNMLPTVSASGSYSRNLELPVIFAPQPIGKMEMGEDNDYTLGLMATQPLFLGFAGVTGHRLAQTAASGAEIQLENTLQATVQGVREAYLAAVLARKVVAVQTEALLQAESNLEQVRRQHRVGAVSRFDLVRAQVQASTTKPALVTATSGQALADARLRMAIGLAPSDAVEPTDTLRAFTSRWQDAPYDSLLGIAYQRRPDIRGAPLMSRMASQGVDLARSSYYPMVAAFGRMQWQAQDSKLVPDEFVRATAVGIQLSWTLWDSWRTPAAVQSANVSVRQVESVSRLIRDGAALEVEAAQRGIQEAGANLKLGVETVALAAEALRLAQVLYEAGGSTQLDVISSQLALTQARMQQAQALYSYHVAHTRMEKALGLIRAEGGSL